MAATNNLIRECSRCGKMLPGSVFFMVIRPGEEWKYFCTCFWTRFPNDFRQEHPIKRRRWTSNKAAPLFS